MSRNLKSPNYFKFWDRRFSGATAFCYGSKKRMWFAFFHKIAFWRFRLPSFIVRRWNLRKLNLKFGPPRELTRKFSFGALWYDIIVWYGRHKKTPFFSGFYRLWSNRLIWSVQKYHQKTKRDWFDKEIVDAREIFDEKIEKALLIIMYITISTN